MSIAVWHKLNCFYLQLLTKLFEQSYELFWIYWTYLIITKMSATYKKKRRQNGDTKSWMKFYEIVAKRRLQSFNQLWILSWKKYFNVHRDDWICITRKTSLLFYLRQTSLLSQVKETTLKQKQSIWVRKRIPRKSRFAATGTLLQKLAIEDKERYENHLETSQKSLIVCSV